MVAVERAVLFRVSDDLVPQLEHLSDVWYLRRAGKSSFTPGADELITLEVAAQRGLVTLVMADSLVAAVMVDKA